MYGVGWIWMVLMRLEWQLEGMVWNVGYRYSNYKRFCSNQGPWTTAGIYSHICTAIKLQKEHTVGAAPCWLIPHMSDKMSAGRLVLLCWEAHLSSFQLSGEPWLNKKASELADNSWSKARHINQTLTLWVSHHFIYLLMDVLIYYIFITFFLLLVTV